MYKTTAIPNKSLRDRRAKKSAPGIAHPGVVLKKEISARGIQQKEFARYMNMTPSNISDLVTGERGISIMIALRLEKVLGIPARRWMALQLEYDIKAARESKHAQNILKKVTPL